MKRRRYITVILFTLFVIATEHAGAQSMPVDENKILRHYPQVSLVFNRIFNGGGLDTFYLRLQELKKIKKGRVTILHIGDSHLQSDHLTDVVRKGFQEFFGSAGKATAFNKTLSVTGELRNKDSNGVLYQSIGINGARFDTYNQSASFWQQVEQLKPDLFIISLGTNDAQTNDFNEASFQQQVTMMLNNLKKAVPTAAVLVTTTADSFKGGVSNRELWNINLSLFGYCSSNNIPVWDMYRVTNGFGSARNWWKKGMLNRDGIHFTSKAYQIQGQLLYNALAKGYNSYISSY